MYFTEWSPVSLLQHPRTPPFYLLIVSPVYLVFLSLVYVLRFFISCLLSFEFIWFNRALDNWFSSILPLRGLLETCKYYSNEKLYPRCLFTCFCQLAVYAHRQLMETHPHSLVYILSMTVLCYKMAGLNSCTRDCMVPISKYLLSGFKKEFADYYIRH